MNGQSGDDLSNIKVEELTDEQVRLFITESDRLGLKDMQIEQLALQKGMSPVEVVKLKTRLQSVRKVLSSSGLPVEQQSIPSSAPPAQDSITIQEQKPLSDYTTVFSALQSKNFGSEVFHNTKITFEPNLRLPTAPKQRNLCCSHLMKW